MKFNRYMGRHYDVQVLDHFTVLLELARERAAERWESLALDIFSNPLPVALQLIEQFVPVDERHDFYEAAMLIESGHPDEAIQSLRSSASFRASLAFDARVWRSKHQHRLLYVKSTIQKNDAKDDGTKLARIIILRSQDESPQLDASLYLVPCLLSPNAPNASAASIMRNAA